MQKVAPLVVPPSTNGALLVERSAPLGRRALPEVSTGTQPGPLAELFFLVELAFVLSPLPRFILSPSLFLLASHTPKGLVIRLAPQRARPGWGVVQASFPTTATPASGKSLAEGGTTLLQQVAPLSCRRWHHSLAEGGTTVLQKVAPPPWGPQGGPRGDHRKWQKWCCSCRDLGGAHSNRKQNPGSFFHFHHLQQVLTPSPARADTISSKS